jgi:hypothetical protein
MASRANYYDNEEEDLEVDLDLAIGNYGQASGHGLYEEGETELNTRHLTDR